MSLLKLLKGSYSLGVLGSLLLSFSAQSMDDVTADDHDSKMVRQVGAGLASMSLSLDDDKAANDDDEKQFGNLAKMESDEEEEEDERFAYLMDKMENDDTFSSAEFRVLLNLRQENIISPVKLDTFIRTLSFNLYAKGQDNGSVIFNPFAREVEFNTNEGHALARHLAEEHDRLVAETKQKIAALKVKVNAAGFDHDALNEYCDLIRRKFPIEMLRALNQALFERSYTQCVNADHFETLKVGFAAAYPAYEDAQWLTERLLPNLQAGFSIYMKTAMDATYTAILTNTGPFNDDLFAQYMRYTHYQPQRRDPYVHDMETAIIAPPFIAGTPRANNIFHVHIPQFEGNPRLQEIATHCADRLTGQYNAEHIIKEHAKLCVNEGLYLNDEWCKTDSMFYIFLDIRPWMNENEYTTHMQTYINRLYQMGVNPDFTLLTSEYLARQFFASEHKKTLINGLRDMFVARQKFIAEGERLRVSLGSVHLSS